MKGKLSLTMKQNGMFLNTHCKDFLIVVSSWYICLLSGCLSVSPSTPSLENISPSPLSSATVAETSSALAVSPSPTQLILTPSFLDSPVAEHVFFPPADEQDCRPPCWQGLRVGESTSADVQTMFDTVFGFHGMRDFFRDPPQFAPVWTLDIPDTVTVGYDWEFLPDVFRVHLVFDQRTDILIGMEFSYRAFQSYKLYSTRNIIQELGAPDYYFTEASKNAPLSSNDPSWPMRIVLIYKQGIVFDLFHTASVEESDGDLFANICLNEVPTMGFAYIMPPFEALSSQEKSPLQNKWLSYGEHPKVWAPGEAFFELSTQEFAEIALREDNPCFLYRPPD